MGAAWSQYLRCNPESYAILEALCDVPQGCTFADIQELCDIPNLRLRSLLLNMKEYNLVVHKTPRDKVSLWYISSRGVSTVQNSLSVGA